MARITCFDGVNCIGGNKILLEDGGARLFFDFGRNFGAEGRFYEEFVQPKPCSGLYEHVQMGLLPPFRDLYRSDLVSTLCDPWEGKDAIEVGEVGGVLVSHAHVDHMGSVRHLRPDIPIYCSPMTAAISRALQDTGRASDGEYCYYVCRTEKDNGGLSSPHWKTHPFAGRKYYLTRLAPAQEFEVFWASAPGGRELEALPCEQSSECAGMRVISFSVDHSVYGATAWAAETDAGWVVYSGDVRLHGAYADYTRSFVEKAAKLGPVALIIEGTRIDSDSRHKEETVRQACLEVARECEGLIVADFGARSVERLLTFLEIARETGRELAILPKDAYLLDSMRCAAGDQQIPSLDEPGFRVYWEYSASDGAKWKTQVAERCPHLIVSPSDVRRNQDKFICCFSFFDVQELAYIKPVPGSIWISSTCEPFNEEMQIDVDRLRHWLEEYEMEFVGGDENSPFHVSGHASGPDLTEIVQGIRPKNLIPVHTEHPEVYSERVGDACRVTIPERGVPIEL